MFPQTQCILEVKVDNKIPQWVTGGIQRYSLEQRPVPKYVMAVEFLNLAQIQTGVYL
jgi:hypothetical protein